jgi:hypothetical protein
MSASKGRPDLAVIGAGTMDRIAPSGPMKNWVGRPYSFQVRKISPVESVAIV